MGCGSVADYLASMQEALSLSSSTRRGGEKKGRKERMNERDMAVCNTTLVSSGIIPKMQVHGRTPAGWLLCLRMVTPPYTPECPTDVRCLYKLETGDKAAFSDRAHFLSCREDDNEPSPAQRTQPSCQPCR